MDLDEHIRTYVCFASVIETLLRTFVTMYMHPSIHPSIGLHLVSWCVVTSEFTPLHQTHVRCLPMSCEGGALVYVTVCYAVCHMES